LFVLHLLEDGLNTKLQKLKNIYLNKIFYITEGFLGTKRLHTLTIGILDHAWQRFDRLEWTEVMKQGIPIASSKKKKRF